MSLRQVVKKIHIAFNSGRFNNRHALYKVTATYLDYNYTVKKVVLRVPELVKRHTSDNIAIKIVRLIRAFEISDDKVGYFTLDNAIVNDCAMEEISAAFSFNRVHYRIRYIGYVVNLVAKDILFGSNAEAFKEAILNGHFNSVPKGRAAYNKWI
jgi:hypothetical protein